MPLEGACTSPTPPSMCVMCVRPQELKETTEMNLMGFSPSHSLPPGWMLEASDRTFYLDITAGCLTKPRKKTHWRTWHGKTHLPLLRVLNSSFSPFSRNLQPESSEGPCHSVPCRSQARPCHACPGGFLKTSLC